MGFRSALKGGGLFTGDGTLGQFVFSAIAPGEKKAGKWAYVVLAFKADGKEKEDTQHLFLGGVKQYQFEEGGTEAISVDEKTGEPTAKSRIGKKTPSGLFFRTLVAAADEASIDIDALLPDIDAGEALDFSALVGARVSLGQEVDVKATADLGKRKGSDGNEYDRTNTVVESFYSVADGDAKPAKGGKSGGKAKKEDTAARDKADAFVQELIAAAQKADKKNKTGETPVSKFKMAALRALAKDEDRDAVIKLLGSEAYRTDAAERDVFAYDADGETVAEA